MPRFYHFVMFLKWFLQAVILYQVFLSNVNIWQTVLFGSPMTALHVQTLWIQVELGVMAIKGFSTLSRSPEQTQFSKIRKTDFLRRSYPIEWDANCVLVLFCLSVSSYPQDDHPRLNSSRQWLCKSIAQENFRWTLCTKWAHLFVVNRRCTSISKLSFFCVGRQKRKIIVTCSTPHFHHPSSLMTCWEKYEEVFSHF